MSKQTYDRCEQFRAAGVDPGAMSIVEELRAAPAAVAGQKPLLAAPVAALSARLRRRPPDVVVTCARGSSAHAATFLKHLVECRLGTPVAAAAPNVATVYRRRLRLDGQLFLAVSQSGRSDDLVETAAMARAAGALTAAVVNVDQSPLAAVCEFVLPVGAGPELSIAATKSFVASLSALLRLVAAWSGDADLEPALDRLPQRLSAARDLDWGDAVAALTKAASLIAIGRGPTLAIAREAALKLKEVCNLHAEAFSGAEFRHGPIALVSPSYPVLILAPTDKAAVGLRDLAADLRARGARVLDRLPALAPDHPDADALCLIESGYAMIVRLALARGVDPDRPRHLAKVTRTR